MEKGESEVRRNHIHAEVKPMLLGIYLAVVSIWCFEIGLAVIGAYILPVLSVAVFVYGYCGRPNASEADHDKE